MRRATSSWAAALLLAEPVVGAGYYLPNQDGFATARGNAWVATADGPAAVFYNPAGLTQLEDGELQLGVYAIQLGTRAYILGGRSRNKAEWQVAPSIFYGGPINDRLSWGVGLYSPFGMGNDWGFGTPFQMVVTEARLLQSTATGALAWEINDCLSLGGSVSVNYQDLTLEQALTPARSVNYLRFEGDGFSATAALSLLWQPHEQHSFGLNWSTESSATLDGDVSSNLRPLIGTGEFDFMTPMRAAAGYSYRPAPGWNIEANIEWLDWDSLNSLSLTGPSVGVIGVPFYWESSFIYEIGVSYVTEDGWKFAIGYDYNESAQPDAFYSPAVSDADIQYLNLGFGRDCDDWGWFFGYQFGYANRVVDGSRIGTNGKYESRHHAVTLTWKRRF